jgi:hypothetical protein
MWLTGIFAANLLLAGLSAGPPAPFQPDWRDDPLYRACDALVSWWPADGHTFDLAGTRHGQPSGPVAFGKGQRGSALSFSKELAAVPTAQPDDLTDTFTLALWVYPTAPRQPTAAHAAQIAGNQNQRYAIYPYNAGTPAKVCCGISVGTNGVGLFEHTNNYLPCVLAHDAAIKDWTHLAVVYTKGQPTLYVNGAAVKTGVQSLKSVIPGTCFGDPGHNYGPYLGRVDEPMLFSRALNEREIKAVLRAAQPHKTPAPGRKFLPLSDAAFADLWSHLAGERAPRTLFAVQRLAASGDESVRRLRTVLLPPVDTGGFTVEELVRRLDDNRFRERERAMQLLLKAGGRVVPQLHAGLKGQPSAEAHARIKLLLRRLTNVSPTPEQMRGVRAITALGWIDSSASRTLLGELAAGIEGAPKTVAARAVLLQLNTRDKGEKSIRE